MLVRELLDHFGQNLGGGEDFRDSFEGEIHSWTMDRK
jgi:hypothetical protein